MVLSFQPFMWVPPSNIGAVKGRYFQGVLKKKNQLIGILNMAEVLNG
jgi:hypothetical protein